MFQSFKKTPSIVQCQCAQSPEYNDLRAYHLLPQPRHDEKPEPRKEHRHDVAPRRRRQSHEVFQRDVVDHVGLRRHGGSADEGHHFVPLRRPQDERDDIVRQDDGVFNVYCLNVIINFVT